MGELLTLVAIAVGTYLMRAAFLVTAAGRRPPAPVARALPHVGPAVLAAITVPAHDEPAHGAVRRAHRLVAHLSGADQRSHRPRHLTSRPQECLRCLTPVAGRNVLTEPDQQLLHRSSGQCPRSMIAGCG